MVSELAGEGAVPPQLPAPARRLLKIAELRDRFQQQIRSGSKLRRGVIKRKVFRYFNPSVGAFQSVIHHRRFRFFPSIASSSLWNRSARCSSKVLVNRTSWSKSVKRSSVVLVNSLSVCVGRSPAIPIQSLSKVLITSLWSRSAKISSAELVVVVSSPQRRTRKEKVNPLFIAFDCRSWSRFVEIDDSSSEEIEDKTKNLDDGEELTAVKEEPENPPANSIKLKKTKEPKAKKSSAPKKRNSPAHPPYFEKVQEAFVTLKERTGSSQYAIQKFTAKKQRSNSRNLLPFHLKKFVAVDKLVKTGGNLAGVVTARIESSTLSFAAEVKKGKVGKDAPINPRLPTDIIIIMYSNGSTRLPKGDMITNGNIVATSAALMSVIPNRGTNDVYVAYLLLTHIFELAVETVMKSELVFDGNLHLAEADKRGAVAVVASKEIGIEESLQCECEWACQVLIERTKFVNECADDGTGFVKARILPYTPFLCFILSWTYKTLHAPAYRGCWRIPELPASKRRVDNLKGTCVFYVAY